MHRRVYAMLPSSFLTQSVPAPSAVFVQVCSQFLAWLWCSGQILLSRQQKVGAVLYLDIMQRFFQGIPLCYVCWSGCRNIMASDFYKPCMDCGISLMQKYTLLSEHNNIKSHCLWRCYTVGIQYVYVCVRGELEIRSMKFVVGKESRQQRRTP